MKVCTTLLTQASGHHGGSSCLATSRRGCQLMWPPGAAVVWPATVVKMEGPLLSLCCPFLSSCRGSHPHVHVDLVGPLPVRAIEQRFLLNMIHHSTRWAEAVPLADTSTAIVAAALTSTLLASLALSPLTRGCHLFQLCGRLCARITASNSS